MIEHIKLDTYEDKELFAFPYGIDDFLVFASVLKRYKEENKNTKIHLLVLSPKQPAFEAQSFIKEIAMEYDYIDDVFEMNDIVLIKNNRLAIDKKRINWYIGLYSMYNKYKKSHLLEIEPRIKINDYRYNIYFQMCTMLKLSHEKPEYILPDSSVKKNGAKMWLKDHGIQENDKYVIVQLRSRFANKNVHINLYKKVLEQIKLENFKLVEMNGNVVEDSINLKPEEVSNLTTLEIVKGAELIIGNISYAYQLGGILNKKTIGIINPQTPSIIRDYNFNFEQNNITFLATDGTLLEWERVRREVPFVHGNDIFDKIVELKLKEINFYNHKYQKNKLTKIILAKKNEYIEKINNRENIEPPLVWYKPDEGMFRFGGHKLDKDTEIKFQALNGLPQLLAYEELQYDKIKVRLTNIYKPIY